MRAWTCQARLLAELVETLNLEAPSIAGHDIGAAITLRAHLLEGVPFNCIALIDSVALRPWITPATNHVKTHLDAYRTMPTPTFQALAASHLRTATHRPMHKTRLTNYLDQWNGELGQKLYLHNTDHLRENDAAEFESLLPSITVPVRIVWGENDAWLPPATAERLHEPIPTSDLILLPDTGHFAMEDSPQEVAATLFDYFTNCST
jgi:pimeloyl-ACP methyl ester carboxylesterase